MNRPVSPLALLVAVIGSLAPFALELGRLGLVASKAGRSSSEREPRAGTGLDDDGSCVCLSWSVSVKSWECMGMHGNVWECLGMYGHGEVLASLTSGVHDVGHVLGLGAVLVPLGVALDGIGDFI